MQAVAEDPHRQHPIEITRADIIEPDPTRLPARLPQQLARADRELLTPDVLTRWGNDLTPEDFTLDTLRDIANLERRRQRALRTLRSTADLTELEFRLVRYLQRHERKTRTYLQLAHHLWGTPDRPITAALLRSLNGYAAPMVGHLHVLVGGIRRKIEIDPIRPQHLATIRGVGYRWYSDPPSLDDGEDYEGRYNESVVLREQVQRELGITEGEYITSDALPDHWEPGAPLLGIDHPDR